MESLVGYGSDDDNETERLGGRGGQTSVTAAGRRREDDTNYDDVNMDMSEGSRTLSQDSQAESEPELPPAEPATSSRHSSQDHRGSDDSRDRDRDRDRDRERNHDRNRSRDCDHDRRDRRRESPGRSKTDRDRRSPRRDDRYNRSSRGDRGSGGSRRGLLGDRPDEKHGDNKVPALMDLKPFGGEAPPGLDARRSQDARDAVSPRFVDRDRRDRDRDRERERDRDKHGRRSEERRSQPERRNGRDRSRSRGAGAAFPPPTASSSGDRRGSPSGDYRPSSYKVNKKLEVMEKMGLQIKTPDGGMATARQLRAAAGDFDHGHLPSYYNPGAMNSTKILDQKRKLLWSHKNKSEAEEAAKWTGAKFAQDNDGKQASKFMRLMGIKDPATAQAETTTVDPVKKQEELFQAMQAQYDVARATTHTMRGVGLGFQRGQF